MTMATTNDMHHHHQRNDMHHWHHQCHDTATSSIINYKRNDDSHDTDQHLHW